MLSDTPFLDASNHLAEGCNWLEELTRAEGDARNECETHEESWDQAQTYLSRAIDDLKAHGIDRVEEGGYEAEGYGWVPIYASVVVDEPAANAAAALTAIFQPLQDLREVALIVPAVTPGVIALLRAALAPFESRIDCEREYLDAQPEPY